MRVELRVATGDSIVLRDVEDLSALLCGGGARLPGGSIAEHTVAVERNPHLKRQLDEAMAAARQGGERFVWLAGWMIRYMHAVP
jgi:hypothetical protein